MSGWRPTADVEGVVVPNGQGQGLEPPSKPIGCIPNMAVGILGLYLSVQCGPQAHPTVHCLLKYRPRRVLKCTVWAPDRALGLSEQCALSLIVTRVLADICPARRPGELFGDSGGLGEGGSGSLTGSACAGVHRRRRRSDRQHSAPRSLADLKVGGRYGGKQWTLRGSRQSSLQLCSVSFR